MRRLGILAAVCGVALCAMSVGRAQPVTVIEEDFEDGAIDGNLLNNAQILDLADGRGSILSLTQGDNSQSGFAWFSEPFNLRDRKVTIDFDFWIRSGSSPVPADGMSVIFQFGNDLNAMGGGGGGLGTCNFPTDYVSVAFDIWDNRETNDAIDPNDTPCFDPASTRTCHVEVNQNNPCPGANPSTQTNVDLGVDAPDFTTIGDTLEPIHATIVFDNGEIEVFLQTDADPAFADPVKVIDVALQDFPDPADAIIGFSASTGGANAHHEIDNLVVVTDEPTPREQVFLVLGDGEKGAINCGSQTEVTGMVNGEEFTFVRDVAFGSFVETREDVIPVQDIFAQYGFVAGGNAAGPADPPIPIANVGDENLQNMYQTERWDNGAVAYRFKVNNGRFQVNLHFAEICPPCGVGPGGAATRRIHARIEGEEALTHWSSALAAGEEAGSLEPLARTAVVRTFEVDVLDGFLDVVISDLGLLGTPPENAQINGISYKRIGDVTGERISGDIEDRGPVELPALEETVLLDTDFDGDFPGECPTDWTCNGTPFLPVVVETNDFHLIDVSPRLRLTDNSNGIAATAIYTEPVDLDRFDFEAEFDVFLTRDLANVNPPADGLTFFFIPGDETVLNAVGAAGGGLGYSGMTTGGFAVEVDTWQGGTDPSGFNTNGFAHVGLVVNGDVNAHVQHNVALDPGLSPPNWPLALVEDPVDFDSGQFLIGTSVLEDAGTAGLHVEVSLNNDRFRVWISTVNQEAADGFVFPRTKVIDTLLSYGTRNLGEGFFGFSAGTGGAVTWHEVDNVRITLVRRKVVRIARRATPGLFTGSATPISVELNISVDPGTGPHDIEIEERLPAGWTAQDISDGGAQTGDTVNWSLTGVSADTTVTYTVIPSDDTRADAGIAGSFSVGGGPDLPIDPTLLLWVPPPFPRGPGEVFISANFDDDADGVCPEGWSCNGGGPPGFQRFVPGVTQEAGFEGRLRLANNTGTIGSTVIWTTPVDLTQNSFIAEFDVYMSNLGDIPADGMTFMVLDASVTPPTAFGAAGGGLGYSGLSGFAVEVDTWDNDGTGPLDPSGYNTNGFAHVAVVRDGVIVPHVQTHLDVNPDWTPVAQGGTGWPNFVDQVSTGIPIHFEVDYNNGRVQVYMEAPATAGEDPFPRTKVLDTVVKFPATDPESDPVLQTAYLGFSAGTGGAMAYMEVDDVEVRLFDKSQAVPEDCTNGADDDGDGLADCDDPDCAAEPACLGVRFVRGDADANGTIQLTDAIRILGFLFQGAAALQCDDAGDADDNGELQITDGIRILQWLFTGGAPPAPPGPSAADYAPGDCGLDPTDDALDCVETAAKCGA